MFRTVSVVQKAGISAAVLGLGFAALLGGCSSTTDTSAVAPANPSATAPHTAASGQAVAEKLAFNQLALDSQVKHIVKNGGVKYLSFAYTDNEGAVYKCEMPEAMSEGTYLPDEWIRTFNMYKLPTLIKQKTIAKKPASQGVDGFPFISPKQSAAPAASQASSPAPAAPRPAAPAVKPPTPAPTPAKPAAAPVPPPKPAGKINMGPMLGG